MMPPPSPVATPRTFGVDVLGCKVNQHEAQQIRRALEAAGLRPAPPGAAPDLVVVHTCAVTAEALRQSRRAVRRARGATARVILSGCGAAGPFAGAIDGAAAVPAGPGWRERLREALATMGVAAAGGAGTPLDRFAGHTRAFLKAQDGCDIGCSYCIVPRLRGPPRDRPADEVVAEARALAAAGHAEMVLTGVCIGLYGRGGGPSLARLVERVAAVEGLQRLRLSSLHPAELTDDLIAAWRASPKMAPHAHLPLQSGSDAVLARMGRGYTAADYLDAVARLRAALDRPAVTTDVIVGFPGETEADVEATLDVCRRAGVSRVHVFRFSPRPGTRAADLGPGVGAAEARARSRRVEAAARDAAAAFHRTFVGGTAEVLAETRSADGAGWEGYCGRYIPFRFPGGPEWGGRIATVRVVAADASGAHGMI